MDNHIIELKEIGNENWRDVYKLEVFEEQKEFVADPGYYMCLCSYGSLWHPLAIYRDNAPIGFIMWAIDDEDNSCWLGGFLIDKNFQRKGCGRKALELIMKKLRTEKNPDSFALSYLPSNDASGLYYLLGFRETGEKEDDEIVARLKLKD
ncbi:GNAT family N-acetyltransferase [Spirochaeta isovalerica]|uniref:Diamine N-acetyltransferase n=1 Tax=Spirochaeta isovalerica TaxID=150 RepID=A0A841RAL6_9SPIO|nr:GNAT family N-acetyltransferase [Spirochaeta isovalerica]MBB6480060.1 diamine N-acetyltransferase [Spirochaeta isovalerica]